MAVDKSGEGWLVKGDPVGDKAFGRPDLADLEDHLNSVLPHSDNETDLFLDTHGYTYNDIQNSHAKAPNINVESFNRTGGKHDKKVLSSIVNQWKEGHLNKVWGKRGERLGDAQTNTAPVKAEVAPVPPVPDEDAEAVAKRILNPQTVQPAVVRGGDYSTSPKKIEEIFGKEAEVLDPASEQPLTPDEQERIANARLLSTPALLSAYGVEAKISDLPEQIQKEISATLAPLKRPIASEIKKRNESVGKTLVKDFGSSFFDDPLVPSDTRERASLRNNLKRLVNTELPDETKKKLQQHIDLIDELNPLIQERQFYSGNITNTAGPERMSVGYEPNPMIGDDFLISKSFGRKADGLQRQVQSSITKYQRDVDPRGIGDAVRTRNRTTGTLEQAGVGGQWDKPTGRGDSSDSADEINLPTQSELESYAIQIGQPDLIKKALEQPEHKRYAWLKSQLQFIPPEELNVINRPTGQTEDLKDSQRPNTALNRARNWSEQADLGGPEMNRELDFDENVDPEIIASQIAQEDGIKAPDGADYQTILQADRILRERRGGKSAAQTMAENDARDLAGESDRFLADTAEDEHLMQASGLPEWPEYQNAKEVQDKVGLGKDDITPLEPDESIGDLTPDEMFAASVASIKDGLLKRALLQRDVADAVAIQDFDRQQKERSSGLNRAIISSGGGIEEVADNSGESVDDGRVSAGKGRKDSSGIMFGETGPSGVTAQSSRLAANKRLQTSNWMKSKRNEFEQNIEPALDEFVGKWTEDNRSKIENLIAQGVDPSSLLDKATADFYQTVLDSGDFMGETSPFASLYMKDTLKDKFYPVSDLAFPNKARPIQRAAYEGAIRKQVEDAIAAAGKGEYVKQADATLSESIKYEQEQDLYNFWREVTDLERSIQSVKNKGQKARALERKLSNVRISSMKAEGQYKDFFGEDALREQWDKFNGLGSDITVTASTPDKQQRLNALKSAGSPAKVFFDNVQDAQEFVAGMPKYESGKAKAELLGDNIVSLKQSALDEAVKKGKIGNQSYTQVQKLYKADDPEAADLDTVFADDTYNTLIATVELSDPASYNGEGNHSDAIRQLVQSARDAGIQGVYYDSKNNTLEIIKPHGIESTGWTDSVAAFVASQGNILRRGDTGRDSPTRWAAGRAKRNVAKRSDTRIHRGLRRSGRGTEPA